MAGEGEKNKKVSQERVIHQSNQKNESFNGEELLKDIKDPSLKKLAFEEYLEYQNKYKQEKNMLSGSSQERLKMLKQELGTELKEDLDTLELFDEGNNKGGIEGFEKEEGIDTFKDLIRSLSENEQENLYTLIHKGHLRDFVDMNGFLPPDREFLDEFFSDGKDFLFSKDFLDKDIASLGRKEIYSMRERLIFLDNHNLLDEAEKDYFKQIKNRFSEIKNKENVNAKQSVNKEKQNVNKEKQNVNKEKQNVNKEKGDFIEKTKTFISYIKSLGFSKESQMLVLIGKLEKSVDNEDLVEIKKANEQIIQYLNSGDNLKTILAEAKKKGETSYRKVFSFVESLASQSQTQEAQQILAKLNEVAPMPNHSPVRETQAKAFFGEGKDTFKREGNKYYSDDKMMDFSYKPPRSYMLSEDGKYKMEADLPNLPTKDIITRRRRLQEIRFKLGENLALKEEYEALKSKQERTPEEQKRFEELDLQIYRIKEEIKDLVKRAELIRKSILEFGIGYKEENRIIKQQETQKQTLHFLHSIGFDLIPQRFTDQLFDEINSDIGGVRGSIDLGDGIRLTEDIDLKNGEFGSKDTKNKREVFVRFFNKMISGNPEAPLPIETFLSEEKDAQFDRQEIIEAFKSGGIMNENGSYIYRQMRDNLKKGKEES